MKSFFPLTQLLNPIPQERVSESWAGFCPCTFGIRKSVLPRESEKFENDSLLALSRGQVGSLAIPKSSSEIKSCN